MKVLPSLSILVALIVLFQWPRIAEAVDGYDVFELERDAGVKSIRRPMAAGLYDSAVDRTFVSWMGEDSHPLMKTYDHQTDLWGDTVQVGTSPFGDTHNYPHLILADDDHLNVFYGAHNSELRHTRSETPLSETGIWTDEFINLASRASYPMPVKADSGDIYVFYRSTEGIDDRPLRYIKSTDHGLSWSGQFLAIGHDRDDNMNEIYMGQIRHEPAGGSNPEKFHMIWTIAGGGFEGPQHQRYLRNVYYAYFDPAVEHFFSISDTDLGPDIDFTDSESEAKVLDTGPPSGHDVDVYSLLHCNDDGSPLLLFTHLDQVKAAVSTGGGWQIVDAPATGRLRDIEKIGPSSFNFLVGLGTSEIQVIETGDGGFTWLDNGLRIVGPTEIETAIFIDDHHADISLVMTEYKPRTGCCVVNVADRNVYVVSEVSDPGIVPGDMNRDGEVNGLDVDPFVDVLLSGLYQVKADMNLDAVVNGLDVDPFVAAVVGGGTQPIPEPSTLLLCLVALAVVGGWWKWKHT